MYNSETPANLMKKKRRHSHKMRKVQWKWVVKNVLSKRWKKLQHFHIFDIVFSLLTLHFVVFIWLKTILIISHVKLSARAGANWNAFCVTRSKNVEFYLCIQYFKFKWMNPLPDFASWKHYLSCANHNLKKMRIFLFLFTAKNLHQPQMHRQNEYRNGKGRIFMIACGTAFFPFTVFFMQNYRRWGEIRRIFGISKKLYFQELPFLQHFLLQILQWKKNGFNKRCCISKIKIIQWKCERAKIIMKNVTSLR